MKKIITVLLFIVPVLLFSACGGNNSNEKVSGGEDVATSPAKDAEIQRYNLEEQRKLSGSESPCDTLSLQEYVLNNYPDGTYIVDFDKTFTYNIPKPAVLYYNKDRSYVFAVLALSKPGERLIEPKNIVGYDQSFIDLDSTKLGTAFFYLTLFKCDGGQFSRIWEAPIPSHGGFRDIQLKRWNYNGTPYIQAFFYYARGIGHIDYNYFLIDGIDRMPHLLMTYKGIDFQRTMANVNDDKYPDYYEYLYYDLGDRVIPKDSIAFVWNTKDSVYVNTRNKRQTRPY